LYAWDLSGRPSIETVVVRIARIYGAAPEGYDRGADLAAQAVAELPEIDRRIGEAAEAALRTADVLAQVTRAAPRN